eukprot:scaffold109_cov252-Pinguiococcus_pyrenoidosus.AAC.57
MPKGVLREVVGVRQRWEDVLSVIILGRAAWPHPDQASIDTDQPLPAALDKLPLHGVRRRVLLVLQIRAKAAGGRRLRAGGARRSATEALRHVPMEVGESPLDLGVGELLHKPHHSDLGGEVVLAVHRVVHALHAGLQIVVAHQAASVLVGPAVDLEHLPELAERHGSDGGREQGGPAQGLPRIDAIFLAVRGEQRPHEREGDAVWGQVAGPPKLRRSFADGLEVAHGRADLRLQLLLQPIQVAVRL